MENIAIRTDSELAQDLRETVEHLRCLLRELSQRFIQVHLRIEKPSVAGMVLHRSDSRLYEWDIDLDIYKKLRFD